MDKPGRTIPHRDEIHLQELGRRAGLLIKIPFVIVTAFGIVTLGAYCWDFMKGHEPFIVSKEQVIWKATIIAYFTSWYQGVQIDKNHEMAIYRSAPRGGRIDAGSVALCVLVFVIFLLMWWTKGEPEAPGAGGSEAAASSWPGLLAGVAAFFSAHGLAMFVVLLNCLWALNIVLWRLFVRRFIKPMSDRSRALHLADGNGIGLVKVDMMDDYIMGRWQWHRFIAGAISIVLAFDLPAGRLADVVATIPYSVRFAIVIVVFEGWVWLKRCQLGAAVACIDHIALHYVLEPAAGDAAG